MKHSLDEVFEGVSMTLEDYCAESAQGKKVVLNKPPSLIYCLATYIPYLLLAQLAGGGDIEVLVTGIQLDVHKRTGVAITDELVLMAILRAVRNGELIIKTDVDDDKPDDVRVNPVWADRQKYADALEEIETAWRLHNPQDRNNLRTAGNVLCLLKPFVMQWLKDRLRAPLTSFLQFNDELLDHLAEVSGVDRNFIHQAFQQLHSEERVELNDARYLGVVQDA
jgi:hypothetical protein